MRVLPSDDKAATAFGVILFWHALFFLDGDIPQVQEYARLSGECSAWESAAIQKKGGIKIGRPVIKKAVKQNNNPQLPSTCARKNVKPEG